MPSEEPTTDLTLKPPTSSSAAEEGTLVVESSSEVSLPSASANVVPETTITFSRQDSESGSREPHPGATGREAAPVDATMAFHPGHVPEPSDATMQLQRGSSEGDAASVDMSAADIDATDFSLDDGTTRRSPRYVQDATVGFLFADEVESARENEAGRGERAESDRSKEFVPGYELLGELGRGGMGVVYKARHKRLNRVVALKMVLSGGHASAAELARFLTEAEAVAALQHPNIVQIHEIGRHNGLPYFTLEFMDGGSLTDRVKEHPLPPREAARIVEAMARAMHFAHERGIIHRDLKPDNVLLTADGTPKITDFGLAKKIEGGSGVTQTGAIMGTPSYMAPEQADGRTKNVGPAADIYSLGAVLYRLIVGRPPFQAATPVETVMMVVRDEPVPPRRLLPRLPKDIETICLKCLQKEPARRYATAAELADDLARFVNDEPVRARPVRPWERWARWVRRHPSTAALVFVGVLAMLGGLAYFAHAHLELRREREAARERLSEQLQRGKEAIARGDWKSAEFQWEQAKNLLRDHPELADEFAEVESLATTTRHRLKALESHAQFVRLRDEALLHAARSSGNGSPTQQAATIQKIETALRSVGANPAGSEPLLLPPGYTTAESNEIAAGCYELLLALAEAHAQPLLGQSAEAHRQRLRESLSLMERAATLGCPDHPTVAYSLRKGRYQRALGMTAAGEVPPEGALQARSALDHYLLGDEYYKQGEIDRAISSFEAVLRADPGHFWARYFLGLCQLRSGRPDLARAHLTACLAENRDVATRAWILLMRGYAGGQMARTAGDEVAATREFQAAEKDFQDALDSLSQTGADSNRDAQYALYNNRGVMRVQMRQIDEGIRDLQQAIRIDPKQYPARVSLALALQQQRRTAEAIEQLSLALETARTLQAEGELDAASVAGLYRQRSQLYLDEWQLARAKMLAGFLAAAGGSAPVWPGLPILGITDDRPCDLARADLKQAVAVLAQVPEADPNSQSRVLLQLGRLDQYREQHEAALETFEAVLRLTPRSLEALRRRAVSRLKLGRILGAEEAFTEYLTECRRQGVPGTVESYLARAYTRERLGRFDGAIEDYSHALALEAAGAHSETRLRRGRLYLATNKPQFALEDFDSAVAAGRVSTDSLLGRALARAKLGLFEPARQDVEAALERDSPSPPMLNTAARVLALAVAAAESGQLRWSADEAYSEAMRTLGLLDRALRAADPRPELFWRNFVRADASYQAIRRAPQFAEWERRFTTDLMQHATRVWANPSGAIEECLEAARTLAQFAEYPPPEGVLQGMSAEEAKQRAIELVRRALANVVVDRRGVFWAETVEADPYLAPLRSDPAWLDLRPQSGHTR